MKNLFSWLKPKSRKPQYQVRPDIRLPFSESKSKRTLSGSQPEKQPANRPTNDSMGNILGCSNCQYPLRVQPSKSSPCPNCGYTGKENQDNRINAAKTLVVSGLEDFVEKGIDRLSFKLIDEATRSELKIECEDPEVVLNRDYLDPGNSTISSEQHVLFKIRDRKIFIEDVSSNGSTFLQIKNTTPLFSGIKLVLGNKIWEFRTSEKKPQSVSDNATRKLGGIEMRAEGTFSGFELIDDKSGKRVSYNDRQVIINRVNLDTSNNTISGSRHAEFVYENGTWVIRDLSSTGATFIQVTSEMLIIDPVKIIIGNKVYTFMVDRN